MSTRKDKIKRRKIEVNMSKKPTRRRNESRRWKEEEKEEEEREGN